MLGLVGRPGILEISPTIGTTKPAPTDAKMPVTRSVKPTGAPLMAGSPVREFDVLAMQMANLS